MDAGDRELNLTDLLFQFFTVRCREKDEVVNFGIGEQVLREGAAKDGGGRVADLHAASGTQGIARLCKMTDIKVDDLPILAGKLFLLLLQRIHGVELSEGRELPGEDASIFLCAGFIRCR